MAIEKPKYENMQYVEARTPEKLKTALMAFDRPHNIMPGSWLVAGQMFGVWIMFDVPVKQIKKRDLVKNQIKVDTETKTL